MSDNSYLVIIERMKSVGVLKNDSAVARSLGVTPQALSNYKKRGRMPLTLVLKFANANHVTMDWLLAGEGEPFRKGFEREEPLSCMEVRKSFGGEDGFKKITSYAILDPEEIKYITRLLKLLRSNNNAFVSPLMSSIDAFCNSTTQSSDSDQDIDDPKKNTY